ncbi:MAG TPA: hypothetical protein VIV60_23660 [Polyangiaceae bacterium]
MDNVGFHRAMNTQQLWKQPIEKKCCLKPTLWEEMKACASIHLKAALLCPYDWNSDVKLNTVGRREMSEDPRRNSNWTGRNR